MTNRYRTCLKLLYYMYFPASSISEKNRIYQAYVLLVIWADTACYPAANMSEILLERQVHMSDMLSLLNHGKN